MSLSDARSGSGAAETAPCVRIGSHQLGAGRPPVFWPDIDVYFKSDLSQAYALIDHVAQAGGKFLKGAVLHRADLCLKSGKEVRFYDSQTGRIVSSPYEDVIARHVVPLETLDKVMCRARDAGLHLVLSVYDHDGVAFARGVGASAIKLPSSNITHKALIEEVASSGLPMVMDTGRSSFAEIERAVGWVKSRQAGCHLLLQHSPPGPPASATRFHLRMMQHMGTWFSCPVGLSDHHAGLAMFPIAIALGACLIEKGLTVDRAPADIDIAHALPVSRLREAMDLMEESWQALGECRRPAADLDGVPIDRMCILARRDIRAGETITRDMLGFAFPPLGIGAEDLDTVIGTTARDAIAGGTPITRELLS